MTWPDVCSHLALAAHVLSQSDEALVLSFGDDDQRVRVERVRAFDEPWLLFLTPVVREEEARSRDALMLNMRMALATLALDQGYLVLRAMWPVERLTERELDRTVSFIVGEARRLRAVHGALRGPVPFDIFGE